MTDIAGKTSLSININKIALVRNSRAGNYPDLIEHARMILAAGADGITVHPRPDQRHVRASDCAPLKKLCDGFGVEFNIEGNPFAPAMRSTRADVGDYPGFMEIIRTLRPAQATLVPDGDAQLTSDHGFDLTRDGDRLVPLLAELKALGVRSSLFMDPVPAQIELAKKIGADRIELYTGPYASTFSAQTAQSVLKPYADAAALCQQLGLGLNAGHDLNLHNLGLFATVPQLREVSIGHAFTVDSWQYGLAGTVARYQQCLGKTPPPPRP
jgi:pyridoxine 5-phosphate synthase